MIRWEKNLDENKLYQLTNDIDFHNNPNFIQNNVRQSTYGLITLKKKFSYTFK